MFSFLFFFFLFLFFFCVNISAETDIDVTFKPAFGIEFPQTTYTFTSKNDALTFANIREQLTKGCKQAIDAEILKKKFDKERLSGEKQTLEKEINALTNQMQNDELKKKEEELMRKTEELKKKEEEIVKLQQALDHLVKSGKNDENACTLYAVVATTYATGFRCTNINLKGQPDYSKRNTRGQTKRANAGAGGGTIKKQKEQQQLDGNVGANTDGNNAGHQLEVKGVANKDDNVVVEYVSLEENVDILKTCRKDGLNKYTLQRGRSSSNFFDAKKPKFPQDEYGVAIQIREQQEVLTDFRPISWADINVNYLLVNVVLNSFFLFVYLTFFLICNI